jgi:hypothetical protein
MKTLVHVVMASPTAWEPARKQVLSQYPGAWLSQGSMTTNWCKCCGQEDGLRFTFSMVWSPS